MKKIIAATALIILLFTGCGLFGAKKKGWLTKYDYRVTVLVDSAISLQDYQVRIEAQGIDVKKPHCIDFSRIKPDGADICLTDSNGLTKLPFWIESWNNEKKTGVIWVKAPELTANQSKIFYLYYGSRKPRNLSSYNNTMQKLKVDSTTRALWHCDRKGDAIRDATKQKNHSEFSEVSWTEKDGGQWADQEDVRFSKGRALEFNGQGNYAEFPFTPELNFTGQQTLTIEAWIFPKDYNSHGTIIAKRGQYYLQVHENGRLACYLSGPKPEKYYYSKNKALLHHWSFVTMTYDGSELKLYINGQLDQTFKITGPITFFLDKIKAINYEHHPVRIGDDATGQNRWWVGLIDEIRILDRVLSAGEIKSDYERRQYTPKEPSVWIGDEEKYETWKEK